MSDPYTPPAAELDAARPDVSRLEWVRYTRWTLWFCGGVYVLMGLVMAPGFLWLSAHDSEMQDMPSWFPAFMGVFLFVVCAGFGAVNLLAAHGLGKGAKWGWILALVMGGIYAPSGCMPFGALILYGLLNERVRKVYLG